MTPIIIILILIANASHIVNGIPKTNLRIKYARELESKYPYIVTIVHNNTTKKCAGTLISPEWVLTAAHCIDDSITHIQYGNVSMEPELSEMISEVIKSIPHPAYRHQESGISSNDIGLCRVKPISIKDYGKTSAVDYRSLFGYGVTFITQSYSKYKVEDNIQIYDITLHIGDGVVTDCTSVLDDIADITFGPYLCVAPKCSNIKEDSRIGDSGEPLFCNGEIVGVVTGGLEKPPIGVYTAVSPFLTWIHKQMVSSVTPKP